MKKYYFIIFIIILILIFIILFFKCSKEIRITVKEKEIKDEMKKNSTFYKRKNYKIINWRTKNI